MRIIIIALFAIRVLASGGYVDTMKIVDIRKNSSGGYVDTFKVIGGGGDVDTARILNAGDYIQIDSRDEYVIKTTSRHLLVDDFKMINKYQKIKLQILDIQKVFENMSMEFDQADVIGELNTSITPFDPEDF